jgi:hypothetical protein
MRRLPLRLRCIVSLRPDFFSLGRGARQASRYMALLMDAFHIAYLSAVNLFNGMVLTMTMMMMIHF